MHTDEVVSAAQVEAYRRDGFVVIDGVLDAAELATLRRVTDELVEASRQVAAHDEVYDLEPSHSAAEPRVRRIKHPHRVHPAYAAMVRHPRILAALQVLMHPSVRFDISKLNLKSAGYGSAVEWHQDWAFYPHTNDDLAAVGIMIDDFTPDNGSMLVIPGSHTGPIYDHNTNGVFVGGIDPSTSGIDFSKAVMCTGRAGSITVHHARLLHGSSANISGQPRRFLLHQYRAGDAWPLVHRPASWEAWTSLLVAGEETLEPRMTAVPVRLPYPASAARLETLYEMQLDLGTRYFKRADEAAGAGV